MLSLVALQECRFSMNRFLVVTHSQNTVNRNLKIAFISSLSRKVGRSEAQGT